MTGRNIPKIAYDGIGKEHWTEGNIFSQHDNISTYVGFESLALRGKSEAEKQEIKEKQGSAITCQPI